MLRFSTLLVILLSYNLGYGYFSLDPNILEYGNLKFNKSLSGSDDVVSDTAVILNEGDVMIILRFTADRSSALFSNGYNSETKSGLYVFTKNSTEDEALAPVNTSGYYVNGSQSSVTSTRELSQYLEGTYIVGPKLVYIAFPFFSGYPFEGSTTINCEMDYAIQRKRTVNPQPVSQ